MNEPRIVVIDTCSECPYYDNEYYSYEQHCGKLDKHTSPDEIPEDCPLEKEKAWKSVTLLKESMVTKGSKS